MVAASAGHGFSQRVTPGQGGLFKAQLGLRRQLGDQQQAKEEESGGEMHHSGGVGL